MLIGNDEGFEHENQRKVPERKTKITVGMTG
jgi:hypothetical protein